MRRKKRGQTSEVTFPDDGIWTKKVALIRTKQSPSWSERKSGKFPRQDAYDEGLPFTIMDGKLPIFFEIVLADGSHALATVSRDATVDGVPAWQRVNGELVSYFQVAAWSNMTQRTTRERQRGKWGS